MQQPLPNGTTAKGLVSLVLWRGACGRLGGKVSMSADEVSEVLKQIGAPLLQATVKETFGALIRMSALEIHQNRDGLPTVFKVTARTKALAQEAADLLQTELVPTKLRTFNEPVVADAPSLPLTELSIKPMPNTTDTRSLIDGFLEILTLASDAESLRCENSTLRAEARTSADGSAIEDAIKTLLTLDSLHLTPVGMLLQEKAPGIVTGAKGIADRLKS